PAVTTRRDAPLIVTGLSYRLGWRDVRDFHVRSVRFAPFHKFEVQDERRVENGNQKQRHKGGDREAADLRVTERFPQRAAVRRQREKRDDGRRDGDEDRPQPHDTGIEQSLDERLTRFVAFLDEVEQHDDMADDDANQARHTEEGHETEWRPHYVERRERPHDTVGDGGKHHRRLDRVLELEDQRHINHGDGDEHHDGQVAEALDLLLTLAADLHLVAGRQPLLELPQLRHSRI